MPLIVKMLLAAVASIFLLAFVASFFRGKPPETYFFCARCKLSTRHSERTIEAWRNKKTRFYCQKCHAAWLESHPAPAGRSARGTGNTGCLGVLVIGVVVTASTIAAVSASIAV